ncbi:hypothetical protein ASB65_25405 [Agrobacterium tumefaciens str. B6]|nr:hypothetical protein ASB65_25405 [Agrobacterium tumefaciens str. B6]OCJ34521.1 hypothetical protein A6U90_26010 [Agrobacterium tumefaciens]
MEAERILDKTRSGTPHHSQGTVSTVVFDDLLRRMANQHGQLMFQTPTSMTAADIHMWACTLIDIREIKEKF